MIGQKFVSHFSVEPIEYEVIREDEPGFYVVQSKTGTIRIMDSRILCPMISSYLKGRDPAKVSPEETNL